MTFISNDLPAFNLGLVVDMFCVVKKSVIRNIFIGRSKTKFVKKKKI